MQPVARQCGSASLVLHSHLSVSDYSEFDVRCWVFDVRFLYWNSNPNASQTARHLLFIPVPASRGTIPSRKYVLIAGSR